MFFINGSINRTDLFYRHTTKSFVPLNERWVEYLISLSETSKGHGVPISERTNTRRQMNLQAIVNPPNVMAGHKYASVTVADPEEVRLLANQGWDEIKTAALTELPGESILRRFIVNDGGFNAIAKLAHAAKEDPDFANALFVASSPENYMPELEPYKAASPAPLLTLHLQAHRNARVKSSSAADLAKGYVFEDLRPKEALNEAIFEAADRELRSVTEPGIYQVMTIDGSMREMICAYHHHLFGQRGGFNYSSECSSSASPLQSILPFVLVDLGDNKTKDLDAFSPATRVLGKFEREIKDSDGTATPTKGKMYRILNLKTKSLSEPVYVESTSKSELGMLPNGGAQRRSGSCGQ